MFVIMVLVSEDDVYGLSSTWRSSGSMPYSSRKQTSAFCLFTKQKSNQSYFLLHFCQHLCSTVVMVLFHFSYQKIDKTVCCEKKYIRNHVFHKLLAWSSHSHSNHVHRVLVKKEGLVKTQRIDGLLEAGFCTGRVTLKQ